MGSVEHDTRRHDCEQTEGEEAMASYRPAIERDVRDTLMDGGTLKMAGIRGWDVTLGNLLNDAGGPDHLLDCEDVINLLTGDLSAVMGIQDKFRPALLKLVNDWIASPSSQSYIERRVSEAIEDAKEEQ